jgi:hypothetical protein
VDVSRLDGYTIKVFRRWSTRKPVAATTPIQRWNNKIYATLHPMHSFDFIILRPPILTYRFTYVITERFGNIKTPHGISADRLSNIFD